MISEPMKQARVDARALMRDRRVVLVRVCGH